MESGHETSDPPSSRASPASSVPLKIKEEPLERDDWQENSSSRPNSVPTALVQPEPVQKHQRLRYYGRKHVASPDTAVCEVCQGEFRGPDVLQIHKLCHFNTSHVCYVCDCYFPNTEVLVLHMATNHRNLSTTTGNYKPEAERSFVCVICLQRFSSNKMLMKHQRTHSEKDSSYNGCKICALDFIGSKALLAHLSSPRHKEMKVKIQSIFVCVDCRSIFATRDSYAMHMMMRAQSETCDKMEDDDTESEGPEQKVMDLIRNSVSDNATAIATSMAMSAMAANGLFLNSMMPSNGKRSGEQSPYTNNNNSTPPSSSEVPGIPLNLSTIKARRLECSACYASFPSEESLAMHKTMMHRHDNSAMRRNPTVSDLLRAQQQLQQAYLPMAHGFLPASAWTCVACGYDLDSCDALAMHMMEKHANQEDNLPMMSIPDPRLIQQKVQQVYAEATLQQHQNGVQTHSAPSPVQQADMRSQSTGALPDEHKQSADEERQAKRRLSLQDDLIYKKAKVEKFAAICLSCNQSFSNKDIFFGHVAKCSMGFQAQCSFCENKFHCKDSFSEHLISCQSNLHACSLCPQTFPEQQMLLNHYRDDHLKLNGDTKHPGNAGYECKRCHAVLNDLQSLMKHARSHDVATDEEGGSTRGCPLCGWSTQDSQMYIQHMLLHNINLEELDLADGRPNGDLSNGMLAPAQKGEPDTRRNRRKPLASAKILPSAHSPDSNELNHMWSESGGSECSTPLPPPPPRSASVQSRNGGGIVLAGAEDLSGEQLLGFLMDNVGMLVMCKHCRIIFTDRTMYHLHMGLHNRNHPWQCNLCGKACRDVHEFSSHVIHY